MNLGVFGSVAPIGPIYLKKENLGVAASPQVPRLSDLLCVSGVDK